MDSTPFSKQCEIMADALVELAGISVWEDLFADYNLGFPLAYSVHHEYAEVNADGANFITDAWSAFCKALNLDEFANYDSLDSMLADL